MSDEQPRPSDDSDAPRPEGWPQPGQPYPGQPGGPPPQPGQPGGPPPEPGAPAQPGGPPPQPGQAYPGPYTPPPGQPYPGQPYPGQPYPGQPQPGQPYWPPPGQPGPFDGRPRGMSNTAKFWLGTALSIPALVLIGVVFRLIGAIFGSYFDGRFALTTVVLLAAAVVGLVYAKTRFVVLGIIAGIAVLFVVLAGACIALLSNLGN